MALNEICEIGNLLAGESIDVENLNQELSEIEGRIQAQEKRLEDEIDRGETATGKNMNTVKNSLL